MISDLQISPAIQGPSGISTRPTIWMMPGDRVRRSLLPFHRRGCRRFR
jgi:hypothetical protein